MQLDDSFPPDGVIAGYQALLDGDDGQINPLFKRLIEGCPDKAEIVDEATALTSPVHTGSMLNTHPSATSQRIAIHHALTAKQGQITAVNGPPGTGKTTLLQSVIASKWVNAAIIGGRPPLIVATAATNQAVTNIIGSFSNALDDNDLFWRTETIRSLGLFLCASSKKKEAQKAGYLYASPDFYSNNPLAHEEKLKLLGSFSADLQQKESLARETQYFLQRAGETSLKKAVDKQHRELIEQHNALLTTLSHVTNALDAGITLESKLADVQEVALNIRSDSDKVGQKIDELERLTQATKLAVATKPFWMVLFSFLPFVKRAARERLQAMLPTTKHITSGTMVNIYGQDFERTDTVQEVYKSLVRFEEQFKQEKKQALDQANSINVIIGLFEANTKQNETTFREITSRKLDCEQRFTLFSLSLNYWFGRFLLEATALLSSPKKQNKREILTRYAMVTPCIVSTMANLSKSIGKTKYWGEGDTRTVIDLLIVDEAGQATPEQSAYFLSLAKNALIVGDEKQIEPVFGIEKAQDIGNLEVQRFNIDVKSIDTYERDKFMSSNGNLMGMALRACHVMTNKEIPGLFLKEHFRCQKEIMAYFNALSYDGLLEWKTVKKATSFQEMSFVHVSTPSEQVNSSRINKGQISAALEWIASHNEELVALHGKEGSTPEKEIAILTPFKEMEKAIKQAAKEQGIESTGPNAMTIGTVHSLQGAERNVVLFLTTYGSNDNKQGFIDNQYNLLNVAASRAKKQFIVFGDYETLSKNKDGNAVQQLYERLSPWEKAKVDRKVWGSKFTML